MSVNKARDKVLRCDGVNPCHGSRLRYFCSLKSKNRIQFSFKENEKLYVNKILQVLMQINNFILLGSQHQFFSMWRLQHLTLHIVNFIRVIFEKDASKSFYQYRLGTSSLTGAFGEGFFGFYSNTYALYREKASSYSL